MIDRLGCDVQDFSTLPLVGTVGLGRVNSTESSKSEVLFREENELSVESSLCWSLF